MFSQCKRLGRHAKEKGNVLLAQGKKQLYLFSTRSPLLREHVHYVVGRMGVQILF